MLLQLFGRGREKFGFPASLPSGLICYVLCVMKSKHDLTAKETCVRRALQNDSIRLIPERCLPFMEMLAGVLETQNKYEEGISVCQEAIRQATHFRL